MIETAAPEGYLQAEAVSFTVEDTGVQQHVYMYDEAVSVVTGDESEIIGYLFMLASSLIVVLGFIYFKVKNSQG